MSELRIFVLDNNERRASFVARLLVFPATPELAISGAMAAISPLTDGAVVGARLYYVWPSTPFEPAEPGAMVPALYLYYSPGSDDWQYISGQIASQYAYDNIMYRGDIDSDALALADSMAQIGFGPDYQLMAIATEVTYV